MNWVNFLYLFPIVLPMTNHKMWTKTAILYGAKISRFLKNQQNNLTSENVRKPLVSWRF